MAVIRLTSTKLVVCIVYVVKETNHSETLVEPGAVLDSGQIILVKINYS